MLARLSLRLDTALNFRQASLLQGAMMERIDPAYGDYLHQEKMHPYSQYISSDKEGTLWWVIQTLNEEAYENILKKWEEGENFFTLRHGGEKTVRILERRKEILAKATLLEDFYNQPAKEKFTVEFLTPTAFRQRKRYVILPDVRLLCQNLMLRYTAASPSVDMTDEDALDELASKTFITRHRLRSLPFPAEGQNIPGFVGSISLRESGTETLARYLRLLLTFGEFAGVGVKTAMGMGAMRLKEDTGE